MKRLKFTGVEFTIAMLIGLIALCFIDIGIVEKSTYTETCTITHLNTANVSTSFGSNSIYKASVKGETIAHVFLVSEEFYASYQEGDTVTVTVKTMYTIRGEIDEYILLEDLVFQEE